MSDEFSRGAMQVFNLLADIAQERVLQNAMAAQNEAQKANRVNPRSQKRAEALALEAAIRNDEIEKLLQDLKHKMEELPDEEGEKANGNTAENPN